MPAPTGQPTDGSSDRPLVDLDLLRPDTRPLSIYLNDHLMGASAGAELFHRAARAAHPEHRAALKRLAEEVAEDRTALIEIMRQLGVPARTYRVVAGWLGEKAGRLKPNGHLVGRAPLSYLIEVEALLLGVLGKRAGWQALREVADSYQELSTERLDALLARAQAQADELETIRTELAGRVLRA
jgi:hypothetical protein